MICDILGWEGMEELIILWTLPALLLLQDLYSNLFPFPTAALFHSAEQGRLFLQDLEKPAQHEARGGSYFGARKAIMTHQSFLEAAWFFFRTEKDIK